MSKEYDEYLKGHIGAVVDATLWMCRHLHAAFDGLAVVEVLEFSANVSTHDASKRSSEEYDAYDAYFYGDKDDDAFNHAWLHHIHHNPRHWQHWLLMNDDGKYRDPDKVIPLEMPKAYALEMVADWWSFSWRTGNLEEVFDWYEEHRDNIILHPKTREFVESVLDEIRERLASE
jgi:hypothetical protein